MSNLKAEAIEFVAQSATPAANPFDNLEALRIDQNFAEQAVATKLLTTVPVGKPNKQAFVRVRPEPEYRMDLACLELKDDREIHIVAPAFASQIPEDVSYRTFFTAMSRQKVLSLWPVKLPNPDGRKSEWAISERLAAEKAMTKWIRVVANMSLGANEIFEAAGALEDPMWPEVDYREILKIAFRNRPPIDSFDHPVMKLLRGAV